MKNTLLLFTFFCGMILLTCDAGMAQAREAGNRQKAKTSKTTKKTRFTGTPGQYPESSDRLLTDKDVEHLTPWGTKVIMNEVYARHGYIFRDKDMRKHFARERWYKGKERNFSKLRLTPTEIQNIAFVKQHQAAMVRR